MASFTDITARKAAEASLRAAHAELESRVEKRTSQLLDANDRLKREVEERERAQREMRVAKEAADTANQAKSAFLANMSHELRTPLNAVIGFSELLEQQIFGDLNPKQQSYVGNVLVSGRHLLQLVNDVLDISKVEAGRMDLACERTPIGSIVDIVRSVIAAVAAKKGIELEVEVPDDLPEVFIDPGRIKQVLYNLISNAIKFTPRGGMVRLTARLDDEPPGGDGLRHGRRDRARGSAPAVPRVRAAPPAGRRAPRGDGPRPGAVAAARRAPRRQGRGGERAREGLGVLGASAAAGGAMTGGRRRSRWGCKRGGRRRRTGTGSGDEVERGPSHGDGDEVRGRADEDGSEAGVVVGVLDGAGGLRGVQRLVVSSMTASSSVALAPMLPS